MLHILYLIHLGNNSGLRGRTYKFGLHLTALEEKQGRDVADTELHGDIGCLVHIALCYEPLALILICKLFHDGIAQKSRSTGI